MQVVYDWTRTNVRGKRFLQLSRNGKKIGTVKTMGDWEEGWSYRAYAGGKQLGFFDTMTAAKIAVEQHLNVSSKKEKRKPQPKRIK